MPARANTTEQDRVRELRVKLYLAAKRSPARRFHALWDRIYRRDVLERAWCKGAPGIDGITITQIEELGVERFLDELQAELKRGVTDPGRCGGLRYRSPAARARGR